MQANSDDGVEQAWESSRAWATGDIGGIVLTRHDRRNAVNHDVADDIDEGVAWLAANGVKVACLSSEGTMFCAGADLRAAARTGPLAADRVMSTLRGSSMIWISAVQGGAIGAGVSIALSCDAVVAGADAWFWLPELTKINRIPVGVITAIAPRMGRAAAIRLALTETKVSAVHAEAAGWVTIVEPEETMFNAAKELAVRLSGVAGDNLAEFRDFLRTNDADRVE